MMKKKRLVTILFVIVTFVGAHSQDASTLKQRFANFLGTNKYVKLVWQSQAGGLPGIDGTSNTVIKALDSKDGIIRSLVGGTGFKHSPTFTWDGTRVIYYNATTLTIHVIGFDGSREKTVISKAVGGGHCWRSGTTDYVLASIEENGLYRLYRVNIDNPSDKTKLYDDETSWISMSVDGTYLAGGFPEVGSVGTYHIASETKVIFKLNGCWPTIARDNTYDVLYTIEPHTSLCLATRTGTKIREVDLTPLLEGRVYETLRWTPDRDYCTISLYDEPKGCQGVPGPKLVRISTVTAVAINDNPTQSEGNMDAFFYTENSSSLRMNYSNYYAYSDYAGDTELFDFCGRTIRAGEIRGKKGLHVSRYVRKGGAMGVRVFP